MTILAIPALILLVILVIVVVIGVLAVIGIGIFKAKEKDIVSTAPMEHEDKLKKNDF